MDEQLLEAVRKTTRVPDLWLLLLACLPRKQAYGPSDVARLLNVGTATIRASCRALWPHWDGHYEEQLNWLQVAQLIKKHAPNARFAPKAAQLYLELLTDKTITPEFPYDHERVLEAKHALDPTPYPRNPRL